jgi:hypothetical protein
MPYAQTNGAANRQAIHTQTNGQAIHRQTNGQAIDADANIQTNIPSNSNPDIQTDNSQTNIRQAINKCANIIQANTDAIVQGSICQAINITEGWDNSNANT